MKAVKNLFRRVVVTQVGHRRGDEVEAAPPCAGQIWAGACSLKGHARDLRSPELSAATALKAFAFLNVSNMIFTVICMPVQKQLPLSHHPCQRSLWIHIYNYTKVSSRGESQTKPEDCAEMNGVSPTSRTGRRVKTICTRMFQFSAIFRVV